MLAQAITSSAVRPWVHMDKWLAKPSPGCTEITEKNSMNRGDELKMNPGGNFPSSWARTPVPALRCCIPYLWDVAG